jgi:iron(III) transport system permease protein
MARYRAALAGLLALLIGVPLLLPVVELLTHPGGWRAWRSATRLGELASNTLILVGGTLALALPVGVALAVLIERSDLPGRRWLRGLLLLTVFVPLPLFASAWQAALGTGGWLRPASDAPWGPWAVGLPAAVWVHAVAALPWVVALVGLGLRWVERETEEDALLAAGPVRVLLRVTLPRARAAVAAAAAWVALQAGTEISVTDVTQVRTFAEDVYTEFVAGGGDELAAAVAVALPAAGLVAALLVAAVIRTERSVPPAFTAPVPLVLLRLGRWRWPVLVLAVAVVLGLAAVPLGGLVWRLGQVGTGDAWSAARAARFLAGEVRSQSGLVLSSLRGGALVGVVTAGLALVACWLAVDSAPLRWFLAVLAAAAWALPGPVIGLGLKSAINGLMDLEDLAAGGLGVPARPLRVSLYDGPSPLPVWWASAVRLLPFALALLWPVVRLVPPELRDAARVEGARPGQEFRYAVWPLCTGGFLRAALAVTALGLGELSAGKLVETPGGQTFAHEVFTQMHYGVTNRLAALCLLLLAAVAIPGAALAALGRRASG